MKELLLIEQQDLTIGDVYILMQDSPEYFTNVTYFNSIISGELVNYNGNGLNIAFIIDSYSIKEDSRINTIIKQILNS